jgi:hypothetical protein
MLEIVATTPAHLRAIEVAMREADRAEIEGCGVSVKKALWRGLRLSPLCRTALIDGAVAAVWGICAGGRNGVSLLGRTAVPWLHTTPAVERMPLAAVRVARSEIRAMQALWPRLENYVAADYAQAVKFLRLLGFTVEAPAPVGVAGALFCRFHLGCE